MNYALVLTDSSLCKATMANVGLYRDAKNALRFFYHRLLHNACDDLLIDCSYINETGDYAQVCTMRTDFCLYLVEADEP